MDENYLDSLLNEFSLDKEIDHKIEDELDDQMEKEKQDRQRAGAVSREDAFNMELEREADSIMEDKDLLFSEDQMDELDQLDQFADLDMGDLDFSDIDFNDLDVTKLDGINGDDLEDLDDLLKDFEGDLKIDDFFGESAEEEDDLSGSFSEQDAMEEKAPILPQEPEQTIAMADMGEKAAENADLNEDSFDADAFLDGLLESADEAEAERDSVVEMSEQQMERLEESDNPSGGEQAPDLNAPDPDDAGIYQAMEDMDGFSDLGQMQTASSDGGDGTFSEMSQEETDELEDLFAMLDMEEAQDLSNTGQAGESSEREPEVQEGHAADSKDPLEQTPRKKKKTLTQILFGDPDEDDIVSEEELAAIEAKKAAKKEKKQAAKAAKEQKAELAKQEKELKNGAKKQQASEKKRLKAEKKAKRRAEEAANAEPEKKLNGPAVAFIFSLFLGGTAFFYMATNQFNYTQAIEKATRYFENQKYRSAYREIVGVDVKENDEKLKDRIYTVMYVERLYEAYENNRELGREEKALDSLLRGVDKYYEHYEEAEELGITSDLDYSFAQIQTALLEQYGITVEQALAINAMENYQYVETVNAYIAQE